MKYLKENKSEFNKMIFISAFFMGSAFISRAEDLKEESSANKVDQEIVTVEHTEDEKIEDKQPEKTIGVIDYSTYGGGGSKVKFKLSKSRKIMESVTDIGFDAFLGSKITYNVPTFFSPIHFDVKVSVSKKSFYDPSFKVTLPLAYVQLDKLGCFSDFKFGITKSLFNKVNTGIPQVQAIYEVSSMWKLAFGIEATSSDAYFKTSKDDDQATEISLNSNGEQALSNHTWVMTKSDLNPLALSFALKFENKDVFEFSSAWLIKAATPFKLEQPSSGTKVNGARFGIGLNSEATAYFFSKKTKVDIQTMVGRGIGSSISDADSSFIVDQEASRKKYCKTNQYGIIDTKVSKPIILWGLRFSCGITQKFLGDYSFALSYNMATAGEELDKLLNVHDKKTGKGYEKEHKVKSAITWNVNDEGKIKLDLGSALSLFCDKPHPFELYAGFKVDFSPK